MSSQPPPSDQDLFSMSPSMLPLDAYLTPVALPSLSTQRMPIMMPPGYTGPPVYDTPQNPSQPPLYVSQPPFNDPSLQHFATACRTGDLTLIRPFVEDQNRAENFLTSGLTQVVEGGHADAARYLLKSGAAIDAQVPLRAAGSGDVGVFRIFVEEFGWDVNSGCMGGGTVLPLTLHSPTLFSYLLSRNANPNLGPPLYTPSSPRHTQPVPRGTTLTACASTSTSQTFSLLLSHNADLSLSAPLHAAIQASASLPPGNRIPMIEYLIDEVGVDVNGLDDVDGNYGVGTPLHMCARWGRVEEAKVLIARGADVGRPSKWGGSVREEAVRNQWAAFAEFLDGIGRGRG
ncbi:ankyrin [Aulographum hederae CBS 113979]|uniref:Ankyrin n=1 Tax=Aulographum hederae CBS 113979 TaxID=1176131 RepID=A0A6G1H505_9PEZI|nr:ankyrin [Aulographum hederae CBS 113979]